MNRSNQTQLTNLAADLAFKRDHRLQPSMINQDDVDHNSPNSEVRPSENTGNAGLCHQFVKEEIKAPHDQNQKNQAVKAEEVKVDISDQLPNFLPHPEQDIEMPEAVNPETLTLPVDSARLKVMKVEDIKKEFYNENKECLLCGTVIERPFKGHMQVHIKKQMTFGVDYIFKPKDNDHPFQIKCKRCARIFAWTDGEKRLQEHSVVCKANASNLNKRLHDSMYDSGYEALEKKFKGEINTLKKKVTALETKLENTDKKLAGVFRTQGSEKKRLDATEKRVGEVEKTLKTVEEKVENHENVLVALLKQLIDQGQLEKSISSAAGRIVRVNQVKIEPKEEEKGKVRDRERSRERIRERSRERRTRQESRERRPYTRERSEERRTTRQYDRERYPYQSKEWTKRRN